MEENNEKRKGMLGGKGSAAGLGMVFGVALGIPFALLFLDGNLSFGIVLGLCFGLIVGATIDGQRKG